MQIITKYLSKNIMVVFFAIFFIISFLISSNIFAAVLKSSLDQNLDIISLLILVFIKSLDSTSLIINLSFFIAIIVAINKMYKDSEMAAVSSIGIGEVGVLKKIAPLILVMTVVVFVISTIIVPYFNVVQKQIIQKNANTSEFNFIKTKEFQKFQGGNIVLYAAGGIGSTLGNLFVYSKDKDNESITLAQDGSRYQDGAGNVYVRIKNGIRYEGFLEDTNKKILEFETLDVRIVDSSNKQTTIVVDTKGRTTEQLLSNPTHENIAEMWWRISLPLSLIILSCIGIFLAKAPPRGGKNLGILYGVILFAVYFNLLKVYRDNITNGESILSSTFPHIIFIVIAIVLYMRNNGVFHRLFRR